jgi:hypothetical protein
VDAFPDLAVPGIAAPKLALIEPDLYSSRYERLADTLRRPVASCDA